MRTKINGTPATVPWLDGTQHLGRRAASVCAGGPRDVAAFDPRVFQYVRDFATAR